MKFLLSLLLCISSLITLGKGPFPYEWEKDRKRYVLSENEKNFNEYVLKYHKEYNYNWENDELIFYLTEHRITRVLNSEAIERHNRIYVSLRKVLELVDIKARCINKDGKITLFDQSNLKEIKEEDSDNSYKIFAIEGIEPDSELEYFYTLKKKWSSSETVYFQFEMPVKLGSLNVTCPKKLSFDFKVYFDTAKVRSDTLKGRRRYAAVFSNVAGLAKEKFSFLEANRKRVETKLAYNYSRSTARLNTWVDAAKSYYKVLAKVDDESEKQVTKFIKTLEDDKKWPTVKRIKNVEDKIKNSIKIVSYAGDGAYELVPDILKYKQGSIQGIMRLFVLIYGQLEIRYNIVMTCNRELQKFDGDFDSWGFLDDYLIYFPEVNGFLSPNENELRYPLVPAKFTANKGLFIEPIAVGNVKSAIGSIREIPALPYIMDKNDHFLDVSFSDDLESNTIHQKLTFVGTDAAYIHSYYNVMTPEQKDKFISEMLRSATPDISIKKSSGKISSADELPCFDIDADFASEHYIEKAGNKILFKVGELIGPQSEMYRDENRTTDIENSNNRGYDRVINVAIPKGYKLSNTSALTMQVLYKSGDQVPFGFTSDFAIEGSILKITVKEFYKEIFAPLSRYEDFRKVINAAADFNKIVLVIEKI